MTIPVNLIGDTLPVTVDDRTALLGGSFYYEPLRVYAALPHKWTWEQLLVIERPVLIDVGASTGCYSLLAAHHPGLTVYAFEPVPLTAEVLRENVRLNGLEDRVHVYQMAVSNYNGMGVLHSVKAWGGSGISMIDGTPAWHKDCDHLPIPVTTLDTFCAAHNIAPDFIKIDIEGNEKAVLHGARRTIETYQPRMLFEYSQENINQYGYKAHELVTMVESWGYVWQNPEGNDLYCIHRDWDKKDRKGIPA